MQSLINTYACIMTDKLYFVSGCCNCSEVSLEYSQRIKKVVEELLKGISKSLGLEEWYIDKAMNMSSGLQVLVANLYPPCPQPEHAMGLPPHSDYGLLTVLTQNEVGGLQVQHQGKWFNVNLIPNSLLVNIGDHLEVLSNGKYKSVLHRGCGEQKSHEAIRPHHKMDHPRHSCCASPRIDRRKPSTSIFWDEIPRNPYT
ncbi:Protein DMR6-like oxygenase 2 [Vitis vinifera]|uniref:Protein DMR6-like oxygenase 2 n=1 Tax=Vitis vinifera TaxID=29760 RepID=A0A438IQ85_VITVI|nr:Protein DMR6-like oxygenase 2 [Vitis vinifera]